MTAAPDDRLPLSALLSQALVAFIVEFDNEFEHQVPHRTTRHSSSPVPLTSAPWLVSMVIWLKFLRYIPPHGISAGELKRIASLSDKELRVWLPRLSRWWGYLVVGPGPVISSSRRSSSSWLIRPTPGGRAAIEAWRPLTATIEQRWRTRFGDEAIDSLHTSAQSLVSRFDSSLPDYLPILGYDLLSHVPVCDEEDLPESSTTNLDLPILLSRILLAFTLEYERASFLSLAISANVLRLIGDEGICTRNLPRLSGVSKEAIAMALGRLEERGLSSLQPAAAGKRGKTLVLTPMGCHARDLYPQLTGNIEQRWKTAFGDQTVTSLRSALEALVLAPKDEAPKPHLSPLFQGLEPYPDGWRASVPRPTVLPHFPIVLHRGGFPDGS